MFAEIFTSMKSTISERVISPLSGVFTIVWLGCNWKPVLIVFLSETPIETRIDLIKNNFADSKINILYPLLITILIVLIYPFAAAAAFWLWEAVSSWKQRIKHRFSMDVPLSLQQSLEIRSQIDEVNRKFSSVLSQQENQIKELQNLNNELSLQLKDKPDTINVKLSNHREIDKTKIELKNSLNNLEKIVKTPARILVTMEKRIERDLEEFIQNEPTFRSKTLMVNVQENNISLSHFPKIPGPAKVFNYSYQKNPDNSLPITQIEKIKKLMISDIKSRNKTVRKKIAEV